MLTIETITTFFAASVLLGIAPGPDNIFVLTQSAVHGRKAGLSITLGLCSGLIVHTTAVALGVAVIIHTSVLAFSILKYVGAAYLLYLAWGAFRASAAKLPEDGGTELSCKRLYLRGIIMNITNPKVTIFFLAFLPQFTDPVRGPVSIQIMLLGGLFIVSGILVFGSIALLAGTLGRWLASSDQAQIILNRLAGAVFLGLALMLATAQR